MNEFSRDELSLIVVSLMYASINDRKEETQKKLDNITHQFLGELVIRIAKDIAKENESRIS